MNESIGKSRESFSEKSSAGVFREHKQLFEAMSHFTKEVLSFKPLGLIHKLTNNIQ